MIKMKQSKSEFSDLNSQMSSEDEGDTALSTYLVSEKVETYGSIEKQSQLKAENSKRYAENLKYIEQLKKDFRS